MGQGILSRTLRLGLVPLDVIAIAVESEWLPPASVLCCGARGSGALLRCANRSSQSSTGPKHGVAIVTLATPEVEDFAAYPAAINAAYARHFDHTFTIAAGSPRFSRGQPNLLWRAGNVGAVLDFLESGAGGAEWVAWLDADAAMVDFGSEDSLLSCIRQYASKETRIVISRGELIGPGASSLFNSGFMLLRRHSWTLKFVRRWWSELETGSENDQEVLERFYRRDELGARSRIALLPQGLFYSEIGDPVAGPPRVQHLVHLAGIPVEVRQGVFGRFWRGLCVATGSQSHGGERGAAIDASPWSQAIRDAYLEELLRFVAARTSGDDNSRRDTGADNGDEACNAAAALAPMSSSPVDESRNCLESAERLAHGLSRRGRLAEASSWAHGALAGRERWLGPLDADTLSSHGTLAGIAEMDGRLEDAVASAQQAVIGRRITYGPHHRATLLSEAKFGGLLTALGRLDEADQPSIVSQAFLTASLGAEHPSALSSATQLAALRQRQRRSAEAVVLYGDAARAAERGLGRKHATTLELQQSRLDVLLELGRADEARRLGRRLVAQRREVAGPTASPDVRVARAMESLSVAVGMGRKAATEAEPLLRNAAEIYDAALGTNAVLTISALQRLAEIAQASGRTTEAEHWFDRAWSAASAPDDLAPLPLTVAANAASVSREAAPRIALRARVANNFGSMLRSSGNSGGAGARTAEAELLLRAATNDFSTALGSHDQSTLRATGNLADLLRALGRHNEAFPLAERALLGMRALGTQAQADALTAESNYALLLHAADRQQEAEARYRAVLTMSENTFGSGGVEAASARADLRALLTRLGRAAEAGALSSSKHLSEL